MSNPYSAAIEWLREIWATGDDEKSRLAAIKLLEAAGKVDKDECIQMLRAMEETYVAIYKRHNVASLLSVKQIRALLASMPEPEKGEPR